MDGPSPLSAANNVTSLLDLRFARLHNTSCDNRALAAWALPFSRILLVSEHAGTLVNTAISMA